MEMRNLKYEMVNRLTSFGSGELDATGATSTIRRRVSETPFSVICLETDAQLNHPGSTAEVMGGVPEAGCRPHREDCPFADGNVHEARFGLFMHGEDEKTRNNGMNETAYSRASDKLNRAAALPAISSPSTVATDLGLLDQRELGEVRERGCGNSRGRELRKGANKPREWSNEKEGTRARVGATPHPSTSFRRKASVLISSQPNAAPTRAPAWLIRCFQCQRSGNKESLGSSRHEREGRREEKSYRSGTGKQEVS
ncbi:hypothetical protein R1sor_014042 [Riccia sorocarpa]|uniref:Uncharacterized protein n=1 Tax=Riccia sorocarpa TaxID=122646 RepID=A0ABD3H8F6_9MARC